MTYQQESKTAILVFARSSQEEIRQKSIVGGIQLFDKLTSHTLDIVKKSGLPYYLISDKEQKGSEFGERFVNAIENIFSKGYRNLITIGNDTPQLKTHHLLKTNEKLNAGNQILGPSFDGGFYLMGIQKTAYNRKAFLSVKWNTSTPAQELLDYFSNHINSTVYLLPKLRDLDGLNDVKQFIRLKHNIPISILIIFRKLLAALSLPSTSLLASYSTLSYTLFFNKGSPIGFKSTFDAI